MKAEDLPLIWIPSLDRLAGMLNRGLSEGRVIALGDFYSGLVKDRKKPLVYLMKREWIKNISTQQRNVARTFWYEKPFFGVEEDPENDGIGRIAWSREKPFGMSISDNSFMFGFNSPYGAILADMTGEFPHQEYRPEMKLCWGDK